MISLQILPVIDIPKLFCTSFNMSRSICINTIVLEYTYTYIFVEVCLFYNLTPLVSQCRVIIIIIIIIIIICLFAVTFGYKIIHI